MAATARMLRFRPLCRYFRGYRGLRRLRKPLLTCSAAACCARGRCMLCGSWQRMRAAHGFAPLAHFLCIHRLQCEARAVPAGSCCRPHRFNQQLLSQ